MKVSWIHRDELLFDVPHDVGDGRLLSQRNEQMNVVGHAAAATNRLPLLRNVPAMYSQSRGDHSGRISGSRFLVLKTKWQYMQAKDCDMGLPFEVLPPLRGSWVIDALYSWG